MLPYEDTRRSRCPTAAASCRNSEDSTPVRKQRDGIDDIGVAVESTHFKRPILQTFHNRSVLSREPDSARRPSANNAIDVMASV